MGLIIGRKWKTQKPGTTTSNEDVERYRGNYWKEKAKELYKKAYIGLNDFHAEAWATVEEKRLSEQLANGIIIDSTKLKRTVHDEV